jgi:hypothetical protein
MAALNCLRDLKRGINRIIPGIIRDAPELIIS